MPTSFRRNLSVVPLLPLVLLAAIQVHAAPKKASGVSAKSAASGTKPALDTASVRKYYMDGDFEPAIDILQEGLKSNRVLGHADSVFAFKHLGVMYAAKYDTREKGKYYMHQLLMTEPTARIMDMYASDMIYMIFKNIQDEFESNRAKFAPSRPSPGATASARPASTSDSKTYAKTEERKPAAESNSGKYYWIGATGLLVAAGVGAYFVMADDSEPRKNDHPVE